MEEITQTKSKKSGNLIAKVFHPVFLFFYCSLFYLYIRPQDFSFVVILLALVFTIIIPIAFIYYSTSGDVYLNDRKKRVIPLLFTAASYFSFYLTSSLFSISIPFLLKAYLLSISIGLFLLFLVNFKFKISLHGSGIGSFLVLSIFVANIAGNSTFSWVSSGFVLLAAYLVLRQRLVSKSHSPVEVVSGFLLGILVSLLVLFLNWKN